VLSCVSFRQARVSLGVGEEAASTRGVRGRVHADREGRV
jgi:hypothetical protein